MFNLSIQILHAYILLIIIFIFLVYNIYSDAIIALFYTLCKFVELIIWYTTFLTL